MHGMNIKSLMNVEETLHMKRLLLKLLGVCEKILL